MQKYSWDGLMDGQTELKQYTPPPFLKRGIILISANKLETTNFQSYKGQFLLEIKVNLAEIQNCPMRGYE